MLLAAVALVGCGTSTIQKAPAAAGSTACDVSRTAAVSASTVYYTSTGKYPTTFPQLTAGSTPTLKVPGGTTVAAHAIKGKSWTLQMRGGGASAPIFVCLVDLAG